MINRKFGVLEEMRAGVCHFDAGMVPIEEVDAELVFEPYHALANAGLANAKRLGGNCHARRPPELATL